MTPLLFDFENDLYPSLRCIPMVVRYKLDMAGVKLSLRAWNRLPRERREELLQAWPVQTPAERQTLRDALCRWLPEVSEEPLQFIALEAPPWEDRTRLCEAVEMQGARCEPPLRREEWAELALLERFALVKLATSKHERGRFPRALGEFRHRRLREGRANGLGPAPPGSTENSLPRDAAKTASRYRCTAPSPHSWTSEASKTMNTPERLVIIGNGMAGAKLLEELLERDRRRFRLTVFGAEPYGNYNRILLSNVLNGLQDPKEIFLNPLGWYHENDITLHAGVKVVAIDRERKVVIGENAIEEPYDRLILATGSRPFVPPMDGADKQGVFLFRTLDDCREIAAYARECRKAVVIGGGLLGLEAARGLLSHGVEVTIVEVAPHLMVQQLDPQGGQILRRTMEGMGLTVCLEKMTTAILGDERVTGLQFKDGETLDTDMVVISCGIRPNSELARECGLAVERAILVDDQLRTDDPAIYAVGECAQHRGMVYGLVAPLYEQAQVLADLLTGANAGASYAGSKLGTKLKVMGVDLVSMGRVSDLREEDEVVQYVEAAAGIYKKLIVRDGRLFSGCLLGDTDNSGALMDMFLRDAEAPERRASLLFPRHAEGAPSARDIPDAALICSCHQVPKQKILAAIGQGRCSLSTIAGSTRAGTGCGGCKPLVQELIDAYAAHVPPDPRDSWYVPGVPYAKPDLIQEIRRLGLKSVSAVFAALANGAEDAGSKMGLASLLKSIWNEEYEDERDARFINDRVHANIQKDATFSVIPRIYGGITSPDQLRRIADAAEKYDVKMVKITGGQRIDLLGVKKEDLPAIWKDLGMPSGHAYTKAFRTCKTCVGTDFCRFGVGDSTALGVQIEQRFQGIEAPHKMKLAASGCPRNCAEATVKDLGAVAVDDGWEVYVGGAAGSRVRAGDLLCKVKTHDEVLLYMGRFIQYYREHGKWMERSPAFVERIGIARLRELLVEDTDGLAAQLDAEIQKAVDAYVDPWTEAHEPYHPQQFTSQVIPAAAVAPTFRPASCPVEREG